MNSLVTLNAANLPNDQVYDYYDASEPQAGIRCTPEEADAYCIEHDQNWDNSTLPHERFLHFRNWLAREYNFAPWLADGQALKFTDGELITTFHGRPEQSLYLAHGEALKLVGSLTSEQRAYITSPERGEYRGFAALHDLCDANMILPGAGILPANDEAALAFWNSVMEHFNQMLA